jgi:RNA polymerase sigma factor (sigma-70 family)
MSNRGLIGAFTEHRPALLRYLHVRGATNEEAQDILQEVHMKLWSEQIGPVEQVRAYLYKMTHNHFLLHRRATSRRNRREEDWLVAHVGTQPELAEQPSDEAALIAREQLAILQRVLDALPDRTRTVFLRFRVDGEAQREIAADLGISVSAIEKHLIRAYQAIAAARLLLDEE